MRNSILYLVLVGLLISTSTNSQIIINYDRNKQVLFEHKNSMDTVFEDFRVGYGINALILDVTTGADTVEIFRSFACTQYSVDKKASKVRLNLWLEFYREGDCICVENDDVKCKPDTTTSNVTLTYSFLNNSILCHISDVKTHPLGDKKFKQFIRHIEMKQFNKLRHIDEKLFVKKKI